MKKIKCIIPIVFNIIISLLYKFCSVEYLREILDGDVLIYIDGRVRYNFGIGSVSVTVMLALMLVTITWILRNAKKHYVGRQQKVYKAAGIVIVLVIDVIWVMHYYEWYLNGLFYYIIQPALENLL